MRLCLSTIAVLSFLALDASAFAQTANAPGSGNQNPPQNSGAQPTQKAQTIRQMLQNNLQQAGFTDIQLMPSSFLVRAKDRQGNKVSMVVTPDGVTAVTELDNDQSNAPGSGGTVGSAPGQSTANPAARNAPGQTPANPSAAKPSGK